MSDQPPATDETAITPPEERFRVTGPLIPLAPDEIYIPATIEELLQGKPGRIVKDPAIAEHRAALAADARASRARESAAYN